MVGGVLMKLWHAPTFPLPLHGNVKEERAKSGGAGECFRTFFPGLSQSDGGAGCVNEEFALCCVLSQILFCVSHVSGAWSERKKMFHGGSFLKLADDDV